MRLREKKPCLLEDSRIKITFMYKVVQIMIRFIEMFY